MGVKMLKFPIVEREEMNLVFKIKVFVGSKIWYFNKFYLSIFQKFGLLHLPWRERTAAGEPLRPQHHHCGPPCFEPAECSGLAKLDHRHVVKKRN
jgi:hypothetical protein